MIDVFVHIRYIWIDLVGMEIALGKNKYISFNWIEHILSNTCGLNRV